MAKKILVNSKPPIDKNIQKTLEKISDIIYETPIKKILLQNKFEKIIPYNLWFKKSSYYIKDIYENNQHLRVRYYDSLKLTPLLSTDENIDHLWSIIPDMSLYQPYYPETFYAIWELLQTNQLNNNTNNFLHIGHEKSVGSLEAIIFFCEQNYSWYQNCVYHLWVAGCEKYDIFEDLYIFNSLKINYLGQTYNIKILQSSNELNKYDFISIDTISTFKDIFIWDNEEEDLLATFFYFTFALKYLNKNGTLLIKTNLLGSMSWNYLFSLGNTYFKHSQVYRPSILNPLNSDIYIFFKNFTGNVTDLFILNFLKIAYLYQSYHFFFLSLPSYDNQITKIIKPVLKSWIKDVLFITENLNCPIKNQCYEWHIKFKLKQIKLLAYNLEDEILKFIIESGSYNNKIKIKNSDPIFLFNSDIYIILEKKRAELNYHKRIMDTKPSNIYGPTSKTKIKYNKLIPWNTLTNIIDPYQKLKYIIRTNYGGEMITNAWIKMYEILTNYPDLLPDKSIIKTFHLCEAPGAFISATNHYASLFNKKINWYAQSLKLQKDNNALEDHFGLIKKYPNKWLLDISDDGNITSSTTIRTYKSNPLLKHIDFMTADGGIYCEPKNINEQESIMCKLLMGQIICVLACLSIKKSAIFKIFLPMMEPLTISLVYLLINSFTKIELFKPSTSRKTNSEVYIIAKQYKGITKKNLQTLYLLLDDIEITCKTMLFTEIDSYFLNSYTKVITQLIDNQISSLQSNYYFYYHPDEIYTLGINSDIYVQKWIKYNPLGKLKDNYRLI